MKDNSFGYVIIALIIIIGSIFIGITQKDVKEEFNILCAINGKKYEAVIYTNNTVKVGYQNCISNNCYIETKEYRYSKEKMKEFRNEFEESYTYYEEYDVNKQYTNVIYNIKLNKALYDESISNNYKLVNIVEKILTGNY